MDPVEKLSIKDACQAISVEFGRLQDQRRHDDLAGLMTPDASYVRLGEELKRNDFIAWIKTTPPNHTRHFVTQTLFSLVTPEYAESVTYYTLYLYGGGEEPPYPLDGPFVVGEYHEKFACTDEGWKIQRREARIVFRKQP